MIPEMDSQSAAWGAHSPLPWRVAGHDIYDANDEPVAYGSDAPEYPEANARLIVASVNSRGKLLEAAKWALSEARGRGLVGTIEALKAAIAAAEQQP